MRFIQKKNNFEDNINVNYNNNNENNNINIVNNIISNDTDKENNNNINNDINNSNNNNSNNSNNNNNNNNNNYKLDYFDSVISLMQGCCYYNIKKFNNSIMKFRACIESNMYYEYSLWNLYLIYKQQDNNEAQMEILFILIQKIIYQKGRIIQDIPINLVFLRMFQLLCETQYEEDIMDYINSISFKKDILFKISNKNDDVSILYLFRNVLRYLIDNKNIEKALDIFIIIISNEPYDIIGSIYYSEILIYYQNNLKLLNKGIRILENIKNYINFVNSSSNKSFLKENDEAIFSNELISTLIKNRNESQNEIEIQNSNDKYDISVEFEKENIEKDYGIIYKYMKMDKILCKDFCDNLANQNYILSIVHWHLSYSYYTLGKLRQAFNSSKVAYLLRPNDITITYNYCILALKIYGINTFEKIAYEWKECRNINKNLETANEIRYKNLDYWMDEIIKHHHV
ncbi:hypothetical protein H8356DRAFT_933022 [Neocallimastix lanati (nom. inval.)]|nr:hypothetical protein H8356DRAFT_933022 [Neocallimastix sp. JGI-2020a]